jgi:serine/threonine protein kinase
MHGAFLHDHDGSSPLVTLVLEYMDKKSLEDLLVQYKERHGTGRVLPEVNIAAISYQILCGLTFLHAPDRRLVHRDLKPGNVLLRSDGCVKLCDFGLAKLLREEDSLNCTVLGTTKYMSPERLRAKPYGRPSDVWSFGLIVWGCATAGESATPWCDDDVHSIVDLLVSIEETSVVDVMTRRQQQQQQQNNNNSATKISQGLQEIISGCLHVDPLKRIPAHILLQSPWFCFENEISNRDVAVQIMCNFFHDE